MLPMTVIFLPQSPIERLPMDVIQVRCAPTTRRRRMLLGYDLPAQHLTQLAATRRILAAQEVARMQSRQGDELRLTSRISELLNRCRVVSLERRRH